MVKIELFPTRPRTNSAYSPASEALVRAEVVDICDRLPATTTYHCMMQSCDGVCHSHRRPRCPDCGGPMREA